MLPTYNIRYALAVHVALLVAIITLYSLIPAGDGTLKDGDTVHMSTVTWGGVPASVPEPIMREMGLKPGQEIDDDTAAELTQRIVKHFKLEARK